MALNFRKKLKPLHRVIRTIMMFKPFMSVCMYADMDLYFGCNFGNPNMKDFLYTPST